MQIYRPQSGIMAGRNRDVPDLAASLYNMIGQNIK